MKTFIKIILISFVLAIFALSFVYVRNRYFPPKTDYYSSNDLSDIHNQEGVDGSSMQSFGINNGDRIRVFIHQDCNVGDICTFTCDASKCMNDGFNKFIKMVTKRNGDCYWFEGNSGHWNENGIEIQSFDSRSYGWLCGKDLTIDGRVEKIN